MPLCTYLNMHHVTLALVFLMVWQLRVACGAYSVQRHTPQHAPYDTHTLRSQDVSYVWHGGRLAYNGATLYTRSRSVHVILSNFVLARGTYVWRRGRWRVIGQPPTPNLAVRRLVY